MEVICGELIDELRKIGLRDTTLAEWCFESPRFILPTGRISEIVREDLVEQHSVSGVDVVFFCAITLLSLFFLLPCLRLCFGFFFHPSREIWARRRNILPLS